MNRSLKYKLSVLFTSLLTLVAMQVLAPSAYAATLHPQVVAWGTINCGDQATVNSTATTGVNPDNGQQATGQTVVNGQSCCPKSAVQGVAADDQPKSCLFAKYINPLINLLSAAVGILVVISIIYGAIMFSTSGGDPQRAANGKNRIRNSLLGLLAYLLLYGFLQFIIPGGKFNG